MATRSSPIYLCFFYAPGEHHYEVLRAEFYSALQKDFDNFNSLGEVFMLGDSNARLGRYLNDRNIHGKLVSNKNKPLLLGFLDYTGLIMLNKCFAIGNATYEIPGKKRSIIDVCLANKNMSVDNFEVLDTVLGCSSQTCHKIIRLTLKISACEITKPALPKASRINHFSFDKLIKVRDFFYAKIRDLEEIRALDNRTFELTYTALRKLYFNAKTKILGFRKTQNVQPKQSSKIKLLQAKIKNATIMVIRDSSESSLLRLQALENTLTKRYYLEKTKRFANWLRNLNKLDFKKKNKSFVCIVTQQSKFYRTVWPYQKYTWDAIQFT